MKIKTKANKAAHEIRTFGDPVLKMRCPEVQNIDGTLVQLAKDMVLTMNAAGGVGLAAPQIGVQKRLFVYDDGHGAETIINPEIVESDGEWTFEEGCLSVPGLYFSIIRPNRIVLKGLSIDGDIIEREATEFLGRIFQHELDHLNGVLLLERLTPEQRKDALRTLRNRQLKAQ